MVVTFRPLKPSKALRIALNALAIKTSPTTWTAQLTVRTFNALILDILKDSGAKVQIFVWNKSLNTTHFYEIGGSVLYDKDFFVF